jgi:hypothetical protein
MRSTGSISDVTMYSPFDFMISTTRDMTERREEGVVQCVQLDKQCCISRRGAPIVSISHVEGRMDHWEAGVLTFFDGAIVNTHKR